MKSFATVIKKDTWRAFQGLVSFLKNFYNFFFSLFFSPPFPFVLILIKLILSLQGFNVERKTRQPGVID